MKVYFNGTLDTSQKSEGKLAKISISPETNSRSGNPITILVANELTNVVSGGDYALGMVGKEGKLKMPMLFPLKQGAKKDDRILVLGEIPQPAHRKNGFIDTELTTPNVVLKSSSGGGAWGSGSVFLALLTTDTKIVSNRLKVWQNKNGVLVETKFASRAEYDLAFNEANIELI